MLMPSINMRQLRDTRKLKSWLRAGKTVELRDRDEVIARIVPQRKPTGHNPFPEIAKFRKELFGSRILPGADLLIEERGRF